MTQSQLHHRILALDGLRFFAALFVVLAHNIHLHFVGHVGPKMAYIANFAGMGMTLFFVLSGFVIHYHYHHLSKSGKIGIFQFLWLRFSRLYPLYIAVIAIDVLTGSKAAGLIAGKAETWTAFLAHVFMIQTWYYDVIGPHNLLYQFGLAAQVAWSISTEMFFYIAYIPLSFLLVRVTRSQRSAWIFALATCTIYYTAFYYLSHQLLWLNAWAVEAYGPIADLEGSHQDSFIRWLTYFSPYVRIIEFVLGAIAASMFLLTRERTTPCFGTLRMLAVGVLVIGLHTLIYSPYWAYAYGLMVSSILYAPLIAVLVYMAAAYRNRIGGFLSSSAIVRLGEASYSIYLLHLPIVSMFRQGMAGQELVDYMLQGMRVLATILVIFIIGRGTYIVYELPAQSWLRGNRQKLKKTIYLFLAAAVVGIVFVAGRANVDPASFDGIKLVSATYGKSCGGASGNATEFLAKACNGLGKCDYKVDVNVLGDPANGCSKDFTAKWLCGGTENAAPKELRIKAEAGLGSIAALACP